MKVKINGKWSKHRKPAPSVVHGFRCENVRLNRHDLRELAGLPDKELCARVRQISARANRVKLYPHQKSILDESHYLKPGLVDMDFAEIEKRVMAQTGTDPDKMGGRFSTAEVQARQEGKQAKLALELWRKANRNLVGFWLEHALKAAVEKAMKDFQTQIDEEGCGAAMAALKEWT